MTDLRSDGHYRVVIRREGSDWLADFPDVAGCHTYAPTLRGLLDEELRDALSLFAADAEDAILEVQLPEEIASAVIDVQQTVSQVEKSSHERSRRMVTAARQLRNAGMTYRDVGAALSISHSRVQQLLSAEDPGTPSPSLIRYVA